MSVQQTTDTDYRLASPVMARLVGSYLVALAVLLVVATVVVASLALSPDLLVILLGAGALGLIAMAWWLRAKLVVVRLTAAGYRVRMIRAVGVPEARWSDVEDAVAATPRGIECVVLRLRDGRSTTVPVQLLAADKDEFARDVREHLRRAAR
ncbi:MULTISPECIES: hypothetical protein [Nocardioides]|uniref:PH domain-containing protein n=1 Tax=Nocardioides vastitatis TaxID=2568655 RepID=A0ABW0ZJB3_9ACTN|nr:hypothetical protein [Nocardioides sp.]THJ05777.1 hypothetical protein E7Z54_06865 [Nocardioides sp.]